MSDLTQDSNQGQEGAAPVETGIPVEPTGGAEAGEQTPVVTTQPEASSYDFDRVLTDEEKVNLNDLFGPPKVPANPTQGGTDGAAQPAAAQAKVEEPKAQVKDNGLEQVQTAISMLAQNQQTLVQAQQRQAQPQEAQQQALLYDFKIPVETLSKVYSENVEERAAGLAQIMQGTAIAVHRNLTQIMNQYAQHEIPRVIQGHMELQQAKQSIHNDFYGTYPELNREELKPLVLQVAQQVLQETGLNGWSNKVRDLTAQKVKSVIQGVIGKTGQSAAAAPRQNFMSPGSGQYGAPSGYTSEELEIQELLAFSKNKGL